MSLRMLVRITAAALTLVLANSAQAQIPQTERDALIALYNSAGGANWINNSGWNGAPGTECTWFGITCDSTSSTVTGIGLHSNNLTGTLSPIGAFSGLQSFDVGDNKLSGTLPSLAGLTSLQYFDASGYYTHEMNNFSGPLPSLSGLVSLKAFFVRNNQLSGTIPSLSGLTSLQLLDLGDNPFNGPVPSLQGLTALQRFSFQYDQLSGPIPALDGLPNLVAIDFYGNQLSGPIPSLAGLPQLQEFDVAYNQLSGPLPSLSGFPALTQFVVQFNNFTGTVPSLTGLSQLQQFDVSFNQLQGQIPSLDGLTSLAEFAVAANQLDGTIPALAGSPMLVDFKAYGNKLTGVIPALAGLTQLDNFQVEGNQLSGSIPSLSGLAALQFFRVQDNQLTGALPSLSGLAALKEFEAWSNQLSGTIPSLSGLTSLTHFAVFSNQLAGPIPSLSDITALEAFNVSSNRLSGPIPSLTGLGALQDFEVQSNQLMGSLPVLSGSPALVFFYAQENQLTGVLPSFSGLTALQQFQANSNQLSGSIPTLAGLTALVIFDVSNNGLTGNLPSLDGLGSLYEIKVGDNQLSGPIPPVPSPDNLAAYHSSLCPNALINSPNAAWDAATGDSPWYDTCTHDESSNGAPTSKDSTQIVLSRDGKIKVFQSLQTDLTSNAGNAGGQDVYSVSTQGQPVLESVDSAGNKLVGMASSPAVSPDGTVVAFLYTPAGAKSAKDFLTGQMFAGPRGQPKHQVDMGMGNVPPNAAASSAPSLSSANGSNQLVFCSAASNLVPGDGNGTKDIFLVDPLNPAIAAQRISVDASGNELPGDSCEPKLSGDGNRVVFSLSAPSLFGTPARQIVLKDLTANSAGKVQLTGQILTITTNSSGQGAPMDSLEPVINQDGSVIAFTSLANLDGIGTPVGGREVFVSLAQPSGRLIERARSGDGTVPDGASQHPQLTEDGTVVAIQTDATNFLMPRSLAKDAAAVAPPQCGAVAITTNFFSVASLGSPLCSSDGKTINHSPAISADGTHSGFDSNAPQANGNTNRNAYAQGIGTYTGVTGTTLPNLSGDFSGQWFDSSQSGQGLVIDVTNPDANNSRLMILTWFVFSNGQPTWVQGVGVPHTGIGSAANTVVVQMDQVAIFKGVSFPLGEAHATPSLWGNITLTFTDANTGTMNWRSTYPGFNSGSMPIKHFLAVSLPANDAVDAQVKSCYSGNWFNPAQAGHGFEFEVLPTTPALLAVDWFAFSPSGAPVWLQGVGSISGNSAQMHLQLIDGTGAQFPPNYNPNSIVQHDWGTATFTFTDASHGSVTWNSTIQGYGSGTQPLQPIVTGLMDRRGCQ